jgi:hypothetical protein
MYECVTVQDACLGDRFECLNVYDTVIVKMCMMCEYITLSDALEVCDNV